jgi:hypothetical protein
MRVRYIIYVKLPVCDKSRHVGCLSTISEVFQILTRHDADVGLNKIINYFSLLDCLYII